MTKHKSIENAINSKSYAYCLQSEYIPETDCSRFTISVNNAVHDLEVYYYADGRYSYYVDDNIMNVTRNVNDLTSWF
jgi:hypothetical protein